jgi:chromate transporter
MPSSQHTTSGAELPAFDKQARLGEVLSLFLKLGLISFGGPVAHISLMEQEAVHRRRWVTREHFLDLLAATNIVPGPNAVEMALHLGFVRAGWPGLVAGGVGFILPAFIISLFLAGAYVRLGALPQVAALFYGINPAVLAIILAATYRLGRTAVNGVSTAVLAAAALIAVLLGVNEVFVLVASALAGVLWFNRARLLRTPPVLGLGPAALLVVSIQWGDDRLLQLGLFFLKVGALLFGSGMVLFAFIERDVVSGFGWLTQQQLFDAIAVGQMTPGPVLSSATFIGYLVAGLPGAVVATIAVFLPSFAIISMVGPWIPRLRGSSIVQAAIKGVNAAVVALILSVCIALLRGAIIDLWTALILLAGLAALLRFRLDSFWLIGAGAAAGVLHILLL